MAVGSVSVFLSFYLLLISVFMNYSTGAYYFAIKVWFFLNAGWALLIFLTTVWPLGGKSACRFDRAQKAIHITSRRYNYTLPWNQIQFRAQWYPSKTGLGTTQLLILGGPPFPEQVLPKNPKRLQKFWDQGGGVLGLGSFPVKNEAQAERWIKFLVQFMETNQDAVELYQFHVIAEGIDKREADAQKRFSEFTDL